MTTNAAWDDLRSALARAVGPDRAEAVALDVCAAVGGRRLPTLDSIRRRERREQRDRAIRSEFGGRNYRALAKRYGVSEDTVRRVVDGPRRRTVGKT